MSQTQQTLACGKKNYTSWAHADADARTIRRFTEEAKTVYRCMKCQAFHVGTPTGKQRGDLMAKRGRPVKAMAIRTDKGRISRSKESLCLAERIELETATWKRRQMNPELTISDARLPQHGSVIMRWVEDWKAISKRRPDINHPNQFTQLHYDTALRYHEVYSRWLSVISARGQRSSCDFSGPGGYDGADPFEQGRADRDAKAEQDFKTARRTVLDAGPLCMMAIEAIVIENQPVENLRGDLRIALNRLAILWKLQQAA